MSIRKGASEAVRASRNHALTWLRNTFFTGIVVGAPIGITIWLIWSFITFVDHRIKPLIPAPWNPETYLKFALPGLGIVVAVVALTLLGAFTRNVVGRFLLNVGEKIVNHVPLISPIYFALKQVFETFGNSEGSSFKEAVLVRFPHTGSWSVGFVTNRAPGGAIARQMTNPIAILIPTVPNPATGFLIYVPAADVVPLDMPIDQALKLVISFGILTPEQLAGTNGAATNAPEPPPIGSPSSS